MNATITEYNRTETALNGLRDRWSVVPDAETKEGYELVKSGISEIKSLRTGLEKERVKLKAPILERGKLLDSEAKRITAELVALEQPMVAAKKLVDEREAREKAERIARLQAKVDEIIAIPSALKGKPSGEIGEAIERLDAIDTTFDYYDLTSEAGEAKRTSLTELGFIMSDRLGFESEQARLNKEAEKQALEREEIRKAQEEIAAARRIVAEAAEIKAKADEKERLEAEAAKEAKEAAEAEKLAQTQPESKPAQESPKQTNTGPSDSELQGQQDRKLAMQKKEEITDSLVLGGIERKAARNVAILIANNDVAHVGIID
jgi:hypothetical protein